jgi:hypothetical protein
MVLVAGLALLASCVDRTIATSESGTDDSGAGSSGAGSSGGGGDGHDGGGGGDDGGGDDGGSSSGAPDDGGSTGTDEGWTTDDGWPTGDGGAFIYGEPDGGVVGQCDPGLQDCPNPDEKCTAYVTEPGYCCVDANKCVPIIGDKTFGELCDRTEENDDCDKGLFCMAKSSGSTGQGVCLEFCVPNDPGSCESGGECRPLNDGVLPLCETRCDPLQQDCPPQTGCYAGFDILVCAVPAHEDGKGNDGDECYAVQDCVPGLICVNAESTAGCAADACCTPFCDLTGPDTQCTDPAEECVSWFEEGEAPPGFDHVGACLIPQ